tara:strand:+ start:14070 stop:14255 length:186 start_codon:yes stop_codon:yes gene_type:complete
MFTFTKVKDKIMKPSNYDKIEAVMDPFTGEDVFVFQHKIYADWDTVKTLVEQEEMVNEYWS